jgi:hypothetical protein
MENNYNDPTADSENETPPNTFTYYKDQQKNIHNPDGLSVLDKNPIYVNSLFIS